MDEASLQRMKKAELETLARAKGLSDQVIFHCNKHDLIEAFLALEPSVGSGSTPHDAASGPVRRSLRRQSTVAIAPLAPGNMKKRRGRRSGRHSRDSKKRRTENGGDDKEGHADVVEGQDEVTVDAEAGNVEDGSSALSQNVPSGAPLTGGKCEDSVRQLNGHDALAEATVIETSTERDDATASYADDDITAANTTDTDDATLFVQRGGTICSSCGVPTELSSTIPGSDEDNPLAIGIHEFEISSSGNDVPLQKLYDVVCDNMKTADALSKLLFSNTSRSSSPQAATLALANGVSARASVLSVLAITYVSLTSICSTLRIPPPTTIPFLDDPSCPDLGELYCAQSELSDLTYIISRKLTGVHANEWKRKKGYKWDKITDVLCNLLKGVDAAKLHISIMIDTRNEAYDQAEDGISQESLSSDCKEGEHVEERDSAGDFSRSDQTEDHVAAWARDVTDSEHYAAGESDPGTSASARNGHG